MRPYCITDDTRDLAVELGISEEAALEHEQEVWTDEWLAREPEAIFSEEWMAWLDED